MKYIRLKTDTKEICIQNRLKYNPEIVEFHLEEHDLQKLDVLEDKIRQVKNTGAKLYLHHPMKLKGRFIDIISEDKEIKEYYDWSSKVLGEICKIHDLHCVLHCSYDLSESLNITNENIEKTRERIREILTYEGSDYFLWENTCQGVFSSENDQLMEKIVKPLNLPLIVDISHSFISLKGNNQKLKKVLDETKEYTKYYHVVDSMGVSHDSLPLGKGKIDWKMVKPYIKDKPFIFEIGLEPPYNNCLPMIESAKYFNNI